MAWPEVGGGGDFDLALNLNDLFERMCAWEDNDFVMACSTKPGSDANVSAIPLLILSPRLLLDRSITGRRRTASLMGMHIRSLNVSTTLRAPQLIWSKFATHGGVESSQRHST